MIAPVIASKPVANTITSTSTVRLSVLMPEAVIDLIGSCRRLTKVTLGRLKVAPVVAELCLGHAQKGIVKVYDRHDYIDEKRSALRQWEAHLLAIVEPSPADDKVVALPARAQR